MDGLLESQVRWKVLRRTCFYCRGSTSCAGWNRRRRKRFGIRWKVKRMRLVAGINNGERRREFVESLRSVRRCEMLAKSCFVLKGGFFCGIEGVIPRQSPGARARSTKYCLNLHIKSRRSLILKREWTLFDLSTNNVRMYCLSLKTLFVFVGSVSNSDHNRGDGLRQPEFLHLEHRHSSFCKFNQ